MPQCRQKKYCIFTIWLCPSTRTLPCGSRKIFSEIHLFYTFYPTITSPWGGASWDLLFLVPSPYIPNLVKIGPVVLEKKMLTETYDARRRTPTHSNRSFEWLRWPKKPQWSLKCLSTGQSWYDNFNWYSLIRIFKLLNFSLTNVDYKIFAKSPNWCSTKSCQKRYKLWSKLIE